MSVDPKSLTATGVYRVVALKWALSLEIKGMKRSKSPSAYATIKREFGFRGNRQRTLEQLTAWIDEHLLGLGGNR